MDLHKIFRFSIFVKGIDSLIDIIIGALLFFITPDTINKITVYFTQKELLEDPRDIVANFLLNFAHSVSINSLLFGAIYLLSHGIIKLALILALWKRRLWAYPTAIIVFFLFMIYQIYRYTFDHSFYLIILTVLDVLVIVLTWWEYGRLKRASY